MAPVPQEREKVDTWHVEHLRIPEIGELNLFDGKVQASKDCPENMFMYMITHMQQWHAIAACPHAGHICP